jgi:hypothetical protein
MPQIPTFTAEPMASPARAPEANPAAFAVTGAAAAGAGAEIGGLGQEWENRYAEARRQADASNLVTAYGKQAEDLYWKYSKVADANAASQGFATDFAALRKQAIAATTDPLIQSYVTREMDQRGLMLGTQVRATAFGLEASKHAGDLDTQAQDLLQRLPAAPNDEYRATLQDQYAQSVAGAVAGHWITPEDGARRMLAFRSGGAEAMVLHDMAANPMGAWQRLNDPNAYPGLPAERRGYYQWRLEPRAIESQAKTVADRLVPLPGQVPANYGPMLESSVAGTPIPADLMAAVVTQESGWNPRSVSSSGARGLAQILPSTARDPGYGVQQLPASMIDDPAANMRFGAQYLAARGAALGVTDWNDPDQVRRALKAYHGAGDASDDAYASAVLGKRGSRPPMGESDEANLYTRAIQMAGDDPRAQEAAVQEVRKRLSLLRATTATARADLDRDLRTVGPALDAGMDVPIPEARVRTLLPPEQANAVLRDLTIRQFGGQLSRDAQWATPDEVQQMLHDASAGTGGKTIELNARLLRAGLPTVQPGTDNPEDLTAREHLVATLAKIAQQRQEALQRDPAGYAASNPDVAQVLKAVDPQQPGTFEAYATKTMALQKHMGVPDDATRVLSVGQAKTMADRLMSADPATADVGAALQQMQGSYGQAWPQVWHDLVRDGGLPPSWQMLGSMTGQGRKDMQRALKISGQKGGIEALRQDADTTAHEIDQGLDTALSDFRGSVVVPGLASDTDLYGAARNAVRTLAYYRALGGQNARDALAGAVADVLPYDFEGPNGRARAPRGVGGQASDYASQMLASLKPEDIAMPEGAAAGMRETDVRQGFLSGLQRQGEWVTNGRGDGWVLVYKRPDGSRWQAVRGDGKPIGFRFADMAELPAQPTRTEPAQPVVVP